MERFVVWSVVLVIASTMVRPSESINSEVSRNESEGRRWTPPFGGWTIPSTTNRPSTRQTTSQPVRIIPTIAKPICDVCCQCEFNNTQIKCKQSPTCREFTLNGDVLPKEAKVVIIIGFSRLKISKHSLRKLNHFQSLSIEKVNDIEMEPYALSLPSCEYLKGDSSLTINSSSIQNFKRRTLTGGWKEIIITNSIFGKTESETFFDTMCLRKLTLERNIISDMGSRTHADGGAQYLIIKDNEIKKMENGAFNLSITESAIIFRNVMGEIQSEAFVLKSPRIFKFINNTVDKIYQHAFQFTATERIDLISNTFQLVSRHAFHQMQITNQHVKLILGLTIKTFDKGALDLHESISVSALQMVDIKLDQDCVCDLQISVNYLFTEMSKDSTNDRGNVQSVVRDSVSCRVQNRTEKAIAFTLSCKTPKVALIASITVTLLTILLLVASVAVVALRQREKRYRKCLETTNRVMRVYTETECRVEEEFVLPLETLNEN